MDHRNGDELEAPLLESAPLPEKRRSTFLTVCPFILGNEFCERLAFYGLMSNMVIYMTRIMGYEPAFASVQLMLFEGTCYLTPILGAWLADSAWGRFKTILVFSIIYFIGMVVLTASAWVPGLTPSSEDGPAKWWQGAFLFGALYIVALGTGGIKPNVSAFGADQFDESDPQDRLEKKSFFNWFYFAINWGSCLAVTVVVYVQDSISWAIGFAIPTVAMAIAIITFTAGSSLYTHVEPTESPMTRVVKVLTAAAKNKWKQRARRRALRQRTGYDGPVNLPIGNYSPGIAAAMARVHSYEWVQDALLDGQEEDDGSVAGFTAEQVEEVRMVVRMFPIFLTTIFYWTIYSQMGSFFVMQGANMDRNMFGGRFVIPSASLSLFNTISIIALIPVYDRGVVPLLQKFGIKITHLQRIGWGLFVCMLSMLAGGAVEMVRLSLFKQGHVLTDDKNAIVDMSVFWQIPQYILVGLSEVLASIGQLEFFYDQAPDVMRSCSMALQLLSVCIGSYLSGALVAAISSLSYRMGCNWLPQDLNYGRLDLFFLLLAGLTAVNMIWFWYVAMHYRYKDVKHAQKRYVGGTSLKPPRGPVPPWARAREVGIPISHRRPTPEMTIGGSPILPEDDVGLYGRSVTFVPESPSLPANFR
ncbi:g11415 [Coccomyxa viridis]|uniref:G11415 protein n=1 Tax=Coccomyxa viridis TaxID=1274662 RepID=A0ABP1GCL8_9CHLO